MDRVGRSYTVNLPEKGLRKRFGSDSNLASASDKAKEQKDDTREQILLSEVKEQKDDFEVENILLTVMTGDICDHKKAFQKLGYNFERFKKIQSEASSLKSGLLENCNKEDEDYKAKQKKFEECCKSISKMHGDLTEFLNMNTDLELKKVSERKERIEKLLEELPQVRPTLSDLPREQWWNLYIDAPMHEEALKHSDPGYFFDQDESPGYQQSMINLFEKVLVPAKNGSQKDMNYDEYTEIHKIVTECVPSYVQKMVMRISSGIRENDNMFVYYGLKPIESSEIQERLTALIEMREERINGLPLFRNWQSLEEDFVEQITQKIVQSPPQAITVGWVRHDYTQTRLYGEPFYGAEPGFTIMIPAYREEEGRRHVNTILESYYQGRERPNQNEYQRLREIARTVRALHVMHPKADGNGRTHIFGLMNKWLIEEGFTPAILPNGPEIFGGSKTLDGLVEDMLNGMHLFGKAVGQNRKKIWESIGKKLLKRLYLMFKKNQTKLGLKQPIEPAHIHFQEKLSNDFPGQSRRILSKRQLYESVGWGSLSTKSHV